ncbi:unnamed protein product, partial [Amoebophrya sp. A120]
DTKSGENQQSSKNPKVDAGNLKCKNDAQISKIQQNNEVAKPRVKDTLSVQDFVRWKKVKTEKHLLREEARKQKHFQELFYPALPIAAGHAVYAPGAKQGVTVYFHKKRKRAVPGSDYFFPYWLIKTELDINAMRYQEHEARFSTLRAAIDCAAGRYRNQATQFVPKYQPKERDFTYRAGGVLVKGREKIIEPPLNVSEADKLRPDYQVLLHKW